MKTVSTDKWEAHTQQILETASELFKTKGYDKTSMRELAQKLGVSPPFIYYYFDSKQALYYACMQRGLLKLDLAGRSITDTVQEDPKQQFVAHVRTLVNWQSSQGAEILDTSTTDRLTPQQRRDYVKMQNDSLHRMVGAIESGRDAGVFNVVDAYVTAFAIIGMGAHIPRWFKRKGRLSFDEVVDVHVALALRMVGAAQ